MAKSKLELSLEAALAEVANLKAAVTALQARPSASASGPRRRGPVFGEGLVFGVGQPRMEYQDHLFAQNAEGWVSVGADGERHVVHLTDEELLILNHVEHPTCTGKMNRHIVRIMRRLFNEGRHSRFQPVPPAVPSTEYDRAGQPVGEWANIHTRTVELLAKAS